MIAQKPQIELQATILATFTRSKVHLEAIIYSFQTRLKMIRNVQELVDIQTD
jgi:hypothetical protein